MSSWNLLSAGLPKLGQQVVLANANRLRSFDPLGCVKDVGVLCDSGNGVYWSTHGETRSLCSDAFTHWMEISDPDQNDGGDA